LSDDSNNFIEAGCFFGLGYEAYEGCGCNVGCSEEDNSGFFSSEQCTSTATTTTASGAVGRGIVEFCSFVEGVCGGGGMGSECVSEAAVAD